MLQTFFQQRYARKGVGEVLDRAGLPYDHPIRQMLENDAEIIGPPGEGYLRIRDDRGQLVSVEKRIEQLKIDPNYRNLFPDPPKIARNNLDEIRDNFERIARGEVEVVK